MRIKAWSIEIVWEDGTTERLCQVPNYVSSAVDTHLDELEEVEQ
jgi:hypothetical protein